MGYILPVNSYQSQQYANRLMDEPHYAKISRLQRVNQVASFMENFEDAASDERARKAEEERGPELAAAKSQHEYIGYVNPNPVGFSPIIANIVDKGKVFNAYR